MQDWHTVGELKKYPIPHPMQYELLWQTAQFGIIEQLKQLPIAVVDK